MVFIDIHCHIDRYDDKKLKNIVKKAEKVNVKIIVNNGSDPEKNLRTLEISEKYKPIKCALGFYPIEAFNAGNSEINKEIDFIRKNKEKVTAIGEVGIDLKEVGIDSLEKQKETLGKFVNLAKELDIPIIIHSRKAEKETVEFLEQFNFKKIIMHCFSGKMSLVKKIVENGWYLSIPASIKHSTHFSEVVKITPIENLFCETDSPFLHPDKERDNEPANVIESYKKIAELKGLKLKEVEKKIEENYIKLFGDL